MARATQWSGVGTAGSDSKDLLKSNRASAQAAREATRPELIRQRARQILDLFRAEPEWEGVAFYDGRGRLVGLAAEEGAYSNSPDVCPAWIAEAARLAAAGWPVVEAVIGGVN